MKNINIETIDSLTVVFESKTYLCSHMQANDTAYTSKVKDFLWGFNLLAKFYFFIGITNFSQNCLFTVS